MSEEVKETVVEEKVTEEENITNQKDFNTALKKRLEEERSKQAEIYAEKYKNYLSPDDLKSKTEELNNQITELGNSLNVANEKATTDAQTIADLQEKLKQIESASLKSRIAHEVGIPYELANRLVGDTEEAIRKDAESLLPTLKTTATSMPIRNPEAREEMDGVAKAFYERTGLKRK